MNLGGGSMTRGVAQGGGLVGSVTKPSLLRRADFKLSAPWVQPQSEVELKLAEIWQDVLRIDAIGAADDFFELGGDSFAATALAAEIEAVFGVRFAPGDIINFSTIAKQAQAVSQNTTSQIPSHLIVGSAEGSKPPAFVVHGSLGFSFFKQAFLDEVGEDRPIYLFQAPGLDGRTRPLGSVEEIANLYVSTIRAVQPRGPYNIVAMCAGSFIALEMCNMIEEFGGTVARLILLDPQSAASARLYSPEEKRPIGKTLRRVLKNSRSRLLFLRKRAFRFFGLGSSGDYAAEHFGQELVLRAKKLKRLRDNIQKRRSGEIDWGSPNERFYSPETMLEVAKQLDGALRTHVPRPYSGAATMLVTSDSREKMVGDGSFWRNHLGGIDYQVCESAHRDIFGANIVETAQFVRSALNSSS
jgi:thioesterase domain-containing protein/acyl carrier protein